jgi:hypothetical protein
MRSIRRRAVGAAVSLAASICAVAQGAPASAAPSDTGYWMVSSTGQVYGFGSVSSVPQVTLRNTVDVAATPDGGGVIIAAKDGSVRAFGTASAFRAPRLTRGDSIVAVVSTPSGKGYWLVSARGRVFPQGDAKALGDASGLRLASPIVDAAGSPSGNGLYLLGGDGGIFTYGDARFAGSTGGRQVSAPVKSIAADPDGSGYWLAGTDGAVYPFNAESYGQLVGTRLNRPIVGIVSLAQGGYMLIGADGGVFTYGSQPFAGSLGGRNLPAPIVAVAGRVSTDPPPPPPTTTTTAPPTAPPTVPPTTTAPPVVVPPVVVTPSVSASQSSVYAQVGTAITPVTVSTANFPGGTTTYGISPALSGGLTFSTATGTISGTPTAFAQTSYTITATNGSTSAQVVVSLGAYSPSLSPSSATASLTQSSSMTSITMSPSGFPTVGTYAYSLVAPGPTSLPAGLNFNTTTGEISGTPSAVSAATVYTIRATRSGITATTTVSITVATNGGFSITTSSLPASRQGVAYTGATLAATGATGAVTWSVAAGSPNPLPAGLDVDTATGAITGQPSCAASTVTVRFQATDTALRIRTADLSITVNSFNGLTAGTSVRLTDSAGALPAALGGTGFDRVFDASNNGCAVVYENSTGGVTYLDRGSNTAHVITGGRLPTVSADSRYVAYSTGTDVRRWDRLSETSTQIAAGPATTGGLGQPGISMSADGALVAFSTEQPLVAGDGGGHDVYRWAASAPTTYVRVSIDGSTEMGGRSPSMSADGSRIAFESDSTVQGPDTNNARDVFLWTAPATITRITAGNYRSGQPEISADGTTVVFNSYASNLPGAAADSNPITGATYPSWAPVPGGSIPMQDDLFAASYPSATCPPLNPYPPCPWANGTEPFTTYSDIFRWRSTGITRVTNGNSGSFFPSVNADGSVVYLDSHASNLASTPAPYTSDGALGVFRWTGGPTSTVIAAPPGTAGQDRSVRPIVSRDGRVVVFATRMTVENATPTRIDNDDYDVAVYQVS